MTNSEAEPQLRRDSLGLPDLVFQAITHIAPATSVVFIFPTIALHAGPAMPLSFLLSTAVCILIGNTVSQFSKFVPSSGGYYSFATRGLGSRTGFMAAWIYLIYEILGAAAAVGFLGYLLSDTFQAEFHLNVPWWFFASATTVLIWALAHRGVQLSVRITTLLGGLELLIMLAFGITFLIHPGPASSYVAPLTPAASPHHFTGILAGMVFSILALTGFEAPAPLAQEARMPHKSVGRAVMLSLFSIGVFFLFMSYASAIGWGTGNMMSFASNANPYYVLGHSLWGRGWLFVVLAIVNSAIAVGIACTNSASRVMYTMGRTGTLPVNFGYIHPTYRTPGVAIAFAQVAGLVAILAVGLVFRPEYIFDFLGTIAALAVIVLYILANLALTRYMRIEQQAQFRPWRDAVVPSVASLVLLPVLLVTVYPAPSYPYGLTPYLFLICAAAGYAYMQWRERRAPGTLRLGAQMIMSGAGTQGEAQAVSSPSAEWGGSNAVERER